MRMKKLSFMILVFWLIAVLAGRFFQLNPNQIDLNAILSLPNGIHLLGADDLGRSILARLLRGVEVSFVVATLSLIHI